MNHQGRNLECDQLEKDERHVDERQVANQNLRMHLRHDWGRPRLSGRGQKIYLIALDLRRPPYVLGRG